jgi:hypothetical protein
MATAQIRWLRAEEGGRLHPPPGPQYSTVARFEDQTQEQWEKEAWSLVVELQGSPDESGHQVAAIRFLSENGPMKCLQRSSKFSLYEGERKVAEGAVVGEP